MYLWIKPLPLLQFFVILKLEIITHLNFRNHVNLHLELCSNKAIECKVPGCKRLVARKDYQQHVVEAAESHYRLQDGEIQRLNRIINKEVKNIEI